MEGDRFKVQFLRWSRWLLTVMVHRYNLGYNHHGKWYVSSLQIGFMTPQSEFSNSTTWFERKVCRKFMVLTPKLEIFQPQVWKFSQLNPYEYHSEWRHERHGGHQAERTHTKTIPSVCYIEIATDNGPFSSIYLWKLEHFQSYLSLLEGKTH